MFSNYHNPNDFWGHDPYKGLNDDERIAAGCMQGIIYIIAMAIGILLCSLFTSCKSIEYVPVIEHKTDTLIQTKVVHDSIHVKDSTHVSEKTINDTVFINRELWHTKYIYKAVHDTLYIAKTDTIPQPYEVIKQVPRQRSTLEWVLSIAGFLSIMGAFLWVVNKLKRYLPGM